MKICYLVGTTTEVKETSTTLDLALECALREHQVHFLQLKDFFVKDGLFFGRTKSLKQIAKKAPASRQDLVEILKGSLAQSELPLMEADIIFIRYTPSEENQRYHESVIKFLSVLNRRKHGPYVFNNPDRLPQSASKIIVRKGQLISNRVKDLRDYCKEELGSLAVAKLFSEQSSGGRDVYFLTPENEAGWIDILRALRKKGYVLVQGYAPNSGDKRVLMLNGEPIGSYLRIGQSNEQFQKHNMSQGAKAVKSELTPEDERIIRPYRPYLIQNGLLLAGLDIVGGIVTEVNVNNPGGTVRIAETTGINPRVQIIDYLENLVKKI